MKTRVYPVHVFFLLFIGMQGVTFDTFLSDSFYQCGMTTTDTLKRVLSKLSGYIQEFF